MSEHDGESKEMAHLRVIRSQVGRMRRLVDDLLDVSRIDRRGGVSIEPIDFDLADEVREAVGRVRREHRDRVIAVDAPDASPFTPIATDRPGPQQPARERGEVLAGRRDDRRRRRASRRRGRGAGRRHRRRDPGGAPRERVRALLPGRWRRRPAPLRWARPGALHQPRHHRRPRRTDLGGRERRGRVGLGLRLPDPARGHAAGRDRRSPRPASRHRSSCAAATADGVRRRARLDDLAARHGLELVGVTSAAPMPADRARMEASVAAGRMGRMGWMGGERPAQATDPRRA